MTAMKTTPVLALSCAVLCCSMAVAQSDVPESEMTLATHTSDEIKEASLKESHKIIYLGSDRENAAAANDKAINSVKNRAVFIFLSNFARDACMQATNLSKIYKIAK